MNMEKLNPWLSLLANVGVLLGIVFLAIQIQQTNRASDAEASRSVNEAMNNVRSILNEHPEVWAKGSLGEELTPWESVIFDNQIESYWARAASSTGARLAIDRSRDPYVALHSFAQVLKKNPGVRDRWNYLMDEDQRYFDVIGTGDADDTLNRRTAVVLHGPAGPPTGCGSDERTTPG